jgi:hypothetical protein
MSRAKDEAMLRYGFTLQRVFPRAKATFEGRPIDLYKRLHRIEVEAHSFAERCCNEAIDEDFITRKEKSLLKRLDEILGWREAGIPVFVNGDPRGYSLKVNDEYMRKHSDVELERDWGGYGILCPEF